MENESSTIYTINKSFLKQTQQKISDSNPSKSTNLEIEF